MVSGTIKIDLDKFVDEFAKSVRVQATEFAQTQAKALVRRDTSQLANSIKKTVKQSTDTESYVYSNSVYAAAQEYGMPGTKYGYTPYMRPSAKIAARKVEAGDFSRRAATTAKRKSTVSRSV